MTDLELNMRRPRPAGLAAWTLAAHAALRAAGDDVDAIAVVDPSVAVDAAAAWRRLVPRAAPR